MRRIAAVVAALMLPMQAQALGVGGDIEWSSALNQPLEAEIGLFAVGSTSQHDIKVKLAPYEAYERAGVEYPSILRELKFSVEQRKNGELYIKVRSSTAIKEPFLDILMEIDWPSGHLLREYTVLLDLPVMTDEVAGPVSAPQTSAMPTVSSDNAALVDERSFVESGAVPAAASGGSIFGESAQPLGSGDLRFGMVKRGDTLWGIAESMRTDKSVSVQQIMMALLKNNPEAFYDNNINNLKAGYVLRLDDPALVTEMSRAEAGREAQRHYQSWLAAKQGRALTGSQATTAEDGATVGVGAESGMTGPSLKLVSPDEADVAMAPKAAGGSSQARNFTNKDLETLRQELTYALEASDAGREENTQLRSRIIELEEQIGKMQRLLSLRDDALSVLQTQSQDESQAAAGTDTAADEVVSETAAGTEAVMSPEDVAVGADETTPEATIKPAEQAAVATGAKPSKPVKPVRPVPAQPAEQGVIDMVLSYVNKAVAAVTSLVSPVLLGGVVGGALLLGGGIWFLRKRKISGDDLEQSMMIEVADRQLSEDMANGTASDLSERKEETSAVDLLDTTSADNIEANIDEIDVLAEADVYLAYQRFDRAEELLRGAVEHEPQRHDLMLKLMEVFIAADNRDGFIEIAERCQANGGEQEAEIWSKVLAMGTKIAADHALFSGAATEAAADDDFDSDLPGGDLDLGTDLDSLDDDFMAGLDDDDGDNAAAVDNLSNELGDLDFGDADQQGMDVEAAQAELSSDDGGLDEPVVESADDGSLDFDMGGLSLDSEDTVQAEAEPESDTLVVDDGGLEFEGGLDMTAGESEPVTESAAEDTIDTTIDTAAADDNALDFDMGDLSLDNADQAQSVEEAEPEAESAEAVDDIAEISLDDGLEDDTVDEGSLEFDSSALESASAALKADDTDDDENPVLVDVEVDESAIDADLSDDIDWLTSVADDAAETNDNSDSFFSSEDEVATKLDLIRAYIDMGDKDSARNILSEVVEEGSEDQKQEAQELLRQIG